jgi:hypothetical protein
VRIIVYVEPRICQVQMILGMDLIYHLHCRHEEDDYNSCASSFAFAASATIYTDHRKRSESLSHIKRHMRRENITHLLTYLGLTDRRRMAFHGYENFFSFIFYISMLDLSRH